jgi:hypothetical protein
VINANRWLDDLPADVPERQLLMAARAVRAPQGSVDRGWQALSLALGAGSATAVVSTEALATAAATKVALIGVGLSMSAKSIAIGFVVGIGALGANQAVDRVGDGHAAEALVERQLSVVEVAAAVAPPLRPALVWAEAQGIEMVLDPGPSDEPVRQSRSGPGDLPAVKEPSPVRSSATATTTPLARTEPEPKASSLAEQARALAHIKRLVDAGAIDEALRRLQSSFLHDADSALAEEREVLTIEALSRVGHRDEAKRRAQRFVARHPHSPYLEKLHGLLVNVE